VAHLHLVHGGASEALSYGRKCRLNGQPVRFIAVSSWVRERLVANGMCAEQIGVIENFLTDERVDTCPRRPAFGNEGIRRLIVISRLDPEKRVDLLLDALEGDPDAGRFEIRVFGTGWNSTALKDHAARAKLNVTFAGFQTNVDACLADSDLLIHTCPEEPFGLAVIEAMAGGIPVIVPDSGGAGSLVADGVSGFHFRANDVGSLRARIRYVAEAGPDLLNAVAREGHRLVETRFSERDRVEDYRRALLEQLS
jgi:glycosyltransferase involved in cell wall biosynthesis